MLALARLQHDGESCRVMSSDVLSCLVMWGVLLDGVRRLVACVGVCWSVCVYVVEESVRVEQVLYGESCHTCKRVMSHMQTSHVTHANESCSADTPLPGPACGVGEPAEFVPFDASSWVCGVCACGGR